MGIVTFQEMQSLANDLAKDFDQLKQRIDVWNEALTATKLSASGRLTESTRPSLTIRSHPNRLNPDPWHSKP